VAECRMAFSLSIPAPIPIATPTPTPTPTPIALRQRMDRVVQVVNEPFLNVLVDQRGGDRRTMDRDVVLGSGATEKSGNRPARSTRPQYDFCG